MKGNRPNPSAAIPALAESRKNFWIGLTLLIALILLSAVIRAFAQDTRTQDTRKVKSSIQPAYPELAKKNNIQGAARLQVLIAPDGSVKDVKVLGGSPVLVQAAVDAVKKWKYEPAPAETSAVVKIEFKP